MEPDEVDELETQAEHHVNRVVGRKKRHDGLYVFGLEWKAQGSADPEITFEPFDDLDDVCQQMVVEAFGAKAATERWKAKSKGKRKKKRKGPKLSVSSAYEESQKWRDDRRNKASNSQGGQKLVCYDDGVEDPEEKTFCATRELAASLMSTVDEQWQADREQHGDDIAAFPQPATAERIQQSLLRLRHMVSQPHINHLVCAVCSERVFASLVHTFSLTFDGRETQKTSKAKARKAKKAGTTVAPALGSKLLETMKQVLARQPGVPDCVGTLTGGQCFYRVSHVVDSLFRNLCLWCASVAFCDLLFSTVLVIFRHGETQRAGA